MMRRRETLWRQVKWNQTRVGRVTARNHPVPPKALARHARVAPLSAMAAARSS
jgi:hypothetical protein